VNAQVSEWLTDAPLEYPPLTQMVVETDVGQCLPTLVSTVVPMCAGAHHAVLGSAYECLIVRASLCLSALHSVAHASASQLLVVRAHGCQYMPLRVNDSKSEPMCPIVCKCAPMRTCAFNECVGTLMRRMEGVK
jgi:hypothetical protein